MKIIGQFNKGFIITKLDNELFIIDQHAADEKRTYEELYNNIKIEKQPLICPQKVEMLSISEKYNLFENKNLFFKLGYNIQKIDDELYIYTYPSIYSYRFEYEDFLNIYYKVDENGFKIDFDESEIKKLFLSDKLMRYIATKSCRSSIMIGTSLEYPKMKEIINKLSYLLSPWNCPHGRPTMRFLYKIKN
jgi:DNA mismatch repair protein PMS2